MCDGEMWCGEPSGPRTRPKNFFFVFSYVWWWDVVWWAIRPKNSAQELLLCVLFFRLVMCDGVENAIRPKNSAQELLLCVLFFRLVMCDGEMWCGEPSGPRTRPKNFFFVFSYVWWWDVVWWAIWPKNSAQELLLCVLFFRLVMCDMVRVLTHIECSHIVLTHRVLTHTSGPRTRPKNFENAIRPKTRPKNFFFVFSSFGLWCVMVRCGVVSHPAQELGPRTSSLRSLMCDGEMWCGEPSGPRTRPKNFFFVFSSFGLWCVMVRCGVVSHPAQELGPRTSSLCSLMCDGEMWCGEPSGPRTRPKNFFFVFSSFGLWCVIWWECSHT